MGNILRRHCNCSLSVKSGNSIILNGKIVGKNVPLSDALYRNAKVRSEAGKLRARQQAKAGAALFKKSQVGLLPFQTKLESSLAGTLKGQILDFGGQAGGVGVRPDFLMDTGETGDVKLQAFFGEGQDFESAFTAAPRRPSTYAQPVGCAATGASRHTLPTAVRDYGVPS